MGLALHSKQTGKYILYALAFFLISGSLFLYLANEENKKFEIELQTFLSLSCEDMKKDFMNLEPWQNEAYLTKISAGEC